MIEELYDVIIIGAGPGGMSAALYASRSNLKTLMIEKGAPGGQMLNTNTIENYIGAKEIDATNLAMQMHSDALEFGAEYVYGEVLKIQSFLKTETRNLETNKWETYSDKHFNVITNTDEYKSKAVIIATGTLHKKINVPGELKLDGKGVSYCATCDGAFFQDKEIAVIGGGDTALESANYLTQYGHVTLIHRRDEYRGEPHLQKIVKENPKVKEILDVNIQSIHGETTVEGVTYQDNKTKKHDKIKVDGVFVNVGQIPQTDFLQKHLLTDEGWIKVDNKYMTETPGLFAIGDVIEKDVRQVANAVGEGSEVVHYLFNYLQEI